MRYTHRRNRTRSAALAGALLVVIVGCHRGGETEVTAAAPGEPQLRSEAELAAAREQRLASGEVIASTPAPPAASPARPAPPPRPRGQYGADLLIVNEHAITAAEVLYPLRDWILEARGSQSPDVFLEKLQPELYEQIRGEIGRLLVFERAFKELAEPAKKSLDDALEREFEGRVARDFGGSTARFESHLRSFGLSMEQFREALRRAIVVQGYVAELLNPQISIRREELLAYFRENEGRFATPESRELLMIEAPYAAFASAGRPYDALPDSAKAPVKLRALRHIRAAHAALSGRSFGEVAREFSKGLHAESGGSWGLIGEPLVAPFDGLTGRIFTFRQGQYSEPIELEDGWYIVGCGRIEAAQRKTFDQVQPELREELRRKRFEKLANGYVVRLAEEATVVGLESFIDASLALAQSSRWPAPE